MNPVNELLIECKDAVFAYDKQPVTPKISFQVEKGDYLCILGGNGVGKTTLVKGIAGLLKPYSGTLTVSETLRASGIGYVPQKFSVSADFPASVLEVVLSGFLKKRGRSLQYGPLLKKRALEVLKQVDALDLKRKFFRELSGGQQQRVLLARALAAASHMLLLDEPIAGLDVHTSARIYEICLELNQNKGMTIVMISHDIETATHNAGTILRIEGNDCFFERINIGN